MLTASRTFAICSHSAKKASADGFVTTEKDAINLGGLLAALDPLAVIPVKMELVDAANAVDTMLRVIAERKQQS